MASRGAGAMDDYDGAYKEIGAYEYEKTDAELPLKVLIFAVLYVVQIIMIVGGCLCIMGAQIAQTNGIQFDSLPFGTMEKELIFVPFACGAASCVAAIVGCFGT